VDAAEVLAACVVEELVTACTYEIEEKDTARLLEEEEAVSVADA
jgi:hypothetical protein